MEVPLLTQDEFFRRLNLRSVHATEGKYHYRQALKERLRASSISASYLSKTNAAAPSKKRPPPTTPIKSPAVTPVKWLTPKTCRKYFGRPKVRSEQRKVLDFDNNWKDNNEKIVSKTNTIATTTSISVNKNIVDSLLTNCHALRHPGIRSEFQEKLDNEKSLMASDTKLKDEPLSNTSKSCIQDRKCYVKPRPKETSSTDHVIHYRVQPKPTEKPEERTKKERKLSAALALYHHYRPKSKKGQYLSFKEFARLYLATGRILNISGYGKDASGKNDHTVNVVNSVGVDGQKMMLASHHSIFQSHINGKITTSPRSCLLKITYEKSSSSEVSTAPTQRKRLLRSNPKKIHFADSEKKRKDSSPPSRMTTIKSSEPVDQKIQPDKKPQQSSCQASKVLQVKLEKLPEVQPKVKTAFGREVKPVLVPIKPENTIENVKCIKCQQTFSHEASLKNHIRKFHSNSTIMSCMKRPSSTSPSSMMANILSPSAARCQFQLKDERFPPAENVKMIPSLISDVIKDAYICDGVMAANCGLNRKMVHQCDICYRKFDKRSRMIRHITGVHPYEMHKVDLSKFVYTTNPKKFDPWTCVET